MQSITLKYCGATNTRGSRWQAKAPAGTRYYPVQTDQKDDGRADAIRDFCKRLDWPGDLVEGNTGDCWVYVFVDGDHIINP